MSLINKFSFRRLKRSKKKKRHDTFDFCRVATFRKTRQLISRETREEYIGGYKLVFPGTMSKQSKFAVELATGEKEKTKDRPDPLLKINLGESANLSIDRNWGVI